MTSPRVPLSLEALRQLAPDVLAQALSEARAQGVETAGKLFLCFDLHTPPGPLLAVEALLDQGKSTDEAVLEVRSRIEASKGEGGSRCSGALVSLARFVSFLERVVLAADTRADLLEGVRAFLGAQLSPGSFPAALISGSSIRLDVLRVVVDRRAN